MNEKWGFRKYYTIPDRMNEKRDSESTIPFPDRDNGKEMEMEIIAGSENLESPAPRALAMAGERA